MGNAVETKTKAELLAEIDQLNQEVVRLREQLNTQMAIVKGSKGPGWIVTTPNPEYSGRVNGIVFENGRAFVPTSHPSAKRVVEVLQSDFGYQAQLVE